MHDIEPVEVGHLVVQYGDVRLQLANQLEALSPRTGLTDDVEIAALAQAARQPVPEEWMIIHDHDPGYVPRAGVSSGLAHAATTTSSTAAQDGRFGSVPTGRAAAYRTIR